MSLEDINRNYESDINESNNDTSSDNTFEENQYENNGLLDEDLNNIDFENIGMVPCEICGTMINFNDYNSHVTDCIRNSNLRRERFNTLNGVINLLNASYDMNRGNNINTMRTPLDEENMNDNDVNVVNADNAVNENSDEQVESYEEFMNSLSPLPNISRFTEIFDIIPSRYESALYRTNNIGRSLIGNLEINIDNLHNLTNENNNMEYDYNLLIQELMGGNVNIGVKDFNKIIEPLNDKDINEEDECCICFDNLKNIMKNNQSNIRRKINIPVKTTCGHKYCRDCLYKWLSKNKKCPVCNNRFEEENEMASLISESD